MTARKLAFDTLINSLSTIDDFEILQFYKDKVNKNTIFVNILGETLNYTQTEAKKNSSEYAVRHIKLMFNLNVKFKNSFNATNTSNYELQVQDVTDKIDEALLEVQKGQITQTDKFVNTLEDLYLLQIDSSELVDTNVLKIYGIVEVKQIIK